MKGIYSIIKNKILLLSVAQWEKIGDEYPPRKPVSREILVLCLVFTLCLVLNQYIGKTKFFKTTEFLEAMGQWTGNVQLFYKIAWAFFRIVTYFLIPVLIIKFFLREKVCQFGLATGKDRKTYLLYLKIFLLILPIVVIVSYQQEFLKTYPIYKNAGNNLADLLLWETAYGLQFFSLEFFFRGFMLFYLARFFGYSAIFIMVIPYTMIHFTKPMAESLGAIIAGTALGTLALRTKSIYGGVFVHTAVAWTMDLLAIYHKGQLGKLFR